MRNRLLAAAAAVAIAATFAAPGQAGATEEGKYVKGIDISRYQLEPDWEAVAADGWKFALIKATQGTDILNPYFAQQYNGSYDAGLIRGAYHFATPDESSGRAQANYFVDHGGDWSSDGKTLPPALDIEFNPDSGGDTCYGLDQDEMSAWIHDFDDRVHKRTGRHVIIYTALSWWVDCVGEDESFAAKNPLWIADPDSEGPPSDLPAGWDVWSFWQYDFEGDVDGIEGPVDLDKFNGSYKQLKELAKG